VLFGVDLPLSRTACHSSFERWSGYDIFSEAGVDELKRDPRNGIDGIDLMAVVRLNGNNACGDE